MSRKGGVRIITGFSLLVRFPLRSHSFSLSSSVFTSAAAALSISFISTHQNKTPKRPRSLLIALSLLLTTDRFSLLQLLGRILRHQLFLLWSALRFCLLGRGLSCLLGCSPLPLPLHFFLRMIRTDQVNSLLLLLLLQLHVSFSHLLLKIIPRHKKHIESLLYLS